MGQPLDGADQAGVTRFPDLDWRPPEAKGQSGQSLQPCTQPYNASVFNISAMSFGAMSANAILALNTGAKLGGFAHVTGEGSISAHHRSHGIARLRRLSGSKPTGFKLCIGHPWEWFAIVKAMLETGITPDFIVVDGAEVGTGAAPVEFSDHLGSPLQEGLLLVHNTLIGVNLRSRISIGAAGKVITAFDRVRLLALVVPDKAERVRNFHRSTLHALQELVQAVGLGHPSELSAHHIVRLLTDTELGLLSYLIMKVQPGALLGSLDAQDKVFRQ